MIHHNGKLITGMERLDPELRLDSVSYLLVSFFWVTLPQCYRNPKQDEVVTDNEYMNE